MINTNVVKNYQTAEYGKFAELLDSQYPPVSVTRYEYRGNQPALSTVDIYPKYAVLSHITNPDDISISLSAGNINIDLDNVEELTITQNTLIRDITSRIEKIESYVDDLESNTYDTASACDDIYRVVTDIYKKLHTGYTKCETRTSGNPSFTSDQVYIYNPNNSIVYPIVTLSSGLSCSIALGKNSESNHALTLNIAVCAVNDYQSCIFTFFKC
jgi:hypothetical protein